MSKILGSWSGMRKYLEDEMLAESLKGRVRYGCTSYPQMDGCHIFELCIDGKQVKRFSFETVNTFFIDNGYKTNNTPSGVGEYWAEFWPLLEKYDTTDRVRNIPTKSFVTPLKCTATRTYSKAYIQANLW